MFIQQLETHGDIPPPRYAHCMVPCGPRHLMLICGEDENRIFSDFYLLNLETLKWELIEVSETYCRTGQTATAINDKQILLFGGNDLFQVQNDVLIIDIDEKRLKVVNTLGKSPMPCCGHSAVLGMRKDFETEIETNFNFQNKNKNINNENNTKKKEESSQLKFQSHRLLIILGGENDSRYLNQTFALDLETRKWREIASGAFPAERRSHSCVVTKDGFHMWIYGGRQDDGSLFDDLWCLDIQSEAWHRVHYPRHPQPGRRSGHRSVLIPDTSFILIFGGWNGEGVVDDFWVFDFDREIWIPFTPRDQHWPLPRSAHALVCPEDGSVYGFGGSNIGGSQHDGDDSLNDLWRLAYSETLLGSRFYKDVVDMLTV
eukprot:gb/GECH01009295.1/.p1 GENE.gb/GECH01009295.1/~~gb/GECH01009295.1/.p1  ORF type:complete len:373 (+),score=94.32 gb/GECH01009295.1/:1-1119(+)